MKRPFCRWLLHHEPPALVVEILHDDTKALILLPHSDSTIPLPVSLEVTECYITTLATERIKFTTCYYSHCYKEVIPLPDSRVPAAKAPLGRICRVQNLQNPRLVSCVLLSWNIAKHIKHRQTLIC